mgnify:CR=1 FL=1
MKRLILLSILVAASLFSCGDDNTEQLPACVDDILQTFINDACPGNSNLELWRFRGQDVYCFNYGDCDGPATAEIYDANCNLICILGGAANNGSCDGDVWSQNATYDSLLFQN